MMELMMKAAAAALLSLLAVTMIRRSNPELAALLSIAAVVVILLSAVGMSEGLQELQQTLRDDFGLNLISVLPVVKCVATAIVTRLTADLCRDHAQSAAAAAVELTGSFVALGIVLPLVFSVLRLIGCFL